MIAPYEYDSFLIQRLFDELTQELNKRNEYLSLTPLASAPNDPVEGWVSLSDGTGSGFDASSGAGLYRYSGSAWVFVG